MKNQLFKISPDLSFTESLLQHFGIKDINDNHSFTKSNLTDLKTVDKMKENINEITKYYIPCKAKKYLINLNEKKCITILRQFIKIHHYKCISHEKSIKGKKQATYRLLYSEEDYLKSPMSNESQGVVVSFD